MAVNLASKYEKKVDERFKLKSLTESAVNRDYDWAGVNAINVYSIPTVAMNNYTKSGLTRYGTAAELDNNVQTLTLTRDRAFTFTIDRANYQDTQMVMQAGKALARQIDEVIVPEIDTYRLATMVAAAVDNGHTDATTPTKDNAYELILKGTEALDDDKVPQGGRLLYVTPGFLNLIKLNPDFIKSTEIAQKMLINGQVGEIDNLKVIKVPTSYMPANTPFLITHPVATVAANKLEDYKTHDNPPGINGWLVEGRKRYDAFVLDNKVNALYAQQTASGS
ncbi:N4-gp56 family major capsid protein [Robertmurraya sp. DFI.2.37]|uniref:N4-gp56 family major capsid protein n=1 Tax=Robertmurraya sp. DFI.2.37 TaxID=3031819 RepID=UPI00124590F3|nr:N4-gp56 family major capsid protein [Robertmurraya sp. DFI.2.37]MDF1507625.1 N4-gp56 family major capsid protein [Robertmurraya sp. DFI.2.37]